MSTTQLPTCTVQDIDHVGIVVKDLEAAMGFFNRVFEIALDRIKTTQEKNLRGVLLSVGQTQIELISPIGSDTPVSNFLSSRGEGLHHLAFRVNNIKDSLHNIKMHGLQTIDLEPRPGLSGLIAFIHPKSVFGVLTELVESFPNKPPGP